MPQGWEGEGARRRDGLLGALRARFAGRVAADPSLSRKGRGNWLRVALILACALLALAVLDRVLPPDLARLREASTVVADRDGAILRAFTTSDGKWRLPARAEEVDPRYLALLQEYEDRRFASHFGVDPLAALRAAWQWAVAGRVVSGASTLTMQTARLLDRHDRSLLGKLGQAARALQLERRLDKPAILSAYLTLAPFGGNLEGVRAASLAWFGKEPRVLTLGEAALLVALPQSPERLRPDRHPEAARAGRDKVLARLRDASAVSEADAAEAMAEPVPMQRLAFPFAAPHLATRLAGAAPRGSVVATTIDGRLQRALEAMAAHEAGFLTGGADIALIVVETEGRRVRGYVGGTGFFGAAGQVDLARARRSPGSALKPFIYGMAFEEGLVHPATLIDDAPARFGDWAPRNFDRAYQGTVSVAEALRQSLNIPAVALLDRIGPVRLAANLRQAGATLAFPRFVAQPTLPVALGGVGIDLADLTMLYAGLADGGRALPLAVTPDPGPRRERRLLSEAASWQVTEILAASALPDGWAQGRGLERPRRIAFKTGTSYGFRDAWAMGWSGRYTIGVWIGRADGTARPGQLARNTAAPILLKAFDLLPAEDDAPRPRPADALAAATPSALPAALRHFALPRETPSPAASAKLRILFPPEGAAIEPSDAGIALKAAGGAGPLLWVVDGVPVRNAPFAAQTWWRPDGDGFTRIAVVDAEGASAAVRVRVIGRATSAAPAVPEAERHGRDASGG
jgi:penicillin-binding protein 1C